MDLRRTPLQIKTNSPTGGGAVVDILFYQDGHYISGGVVLHLNQQIEYRLHYCTYNLASLSNVPLTDTKIWTMQRTTDGVNIECNGKLVLNYRISDCPDAQKWVYNRVTAYVEFRNEDTATEYHRRKGCYFCIFINQNLSSLLRRYFIKLKNLPKNYAVCTNLFRHIIKEIRLSG